MHGVEIELKPNEAKYLRNVSPKIDFDALF